MKNLKIKSLVFLIFAFAFLTPPAPAQVRPVYDYGALGLGQLLKRLPTTKSVMMIGAHPDDEDSALLAYFARGENARTAYLSLTRGDGGQNIIGSELFESLGVIRTEELLQARRLDGAQQFFTRAFDFGFTKTLEETKQKWDEKIILCDAVRAIRLFRPLVVVSRFAGTPADGHGQHQYAGYISPRAVRAASDASQCSDAGAPWQVLKFYVEQGFRDTSAPALKINTGEYDALLGRSYAEIAAEGRSLHRTQEQGGLELKGERLSGLNLIESKAPKVENERSVFDGIDFSLTGITKLTNLPQDFKKNDLTGVQNSAERALREFDANNPRRIVPVLTDGYKAILSAQAPATISLSGKDSSKLSEAWRFFAEKKQEFSDAVKLASGIQIDALADKEIVTRGESFPVAARVYFPNGSNVKVKEINLQTPNGWQVSKADAPKETSQGFFRREVANEAAYFNVKVAEDAKSTEPFWLENSRRGDLFDLPNGDNLVEPFQKQLIYAEVKVEIEGAEIVLNQPVEYRYADSVRGEMRRELNVVPEFSANLDQNLLIVPESGEPQTRRVRLTVTNLSDRPLEASACLCAALLGGWKSSPASQDFTLKNKGEKTSIAFDLTVPARTKEGTYTLLPGVAYAEGFSRDEMREISYPHIQTHRFYTQVEAKVSVLDLKVEPVKIGYITGSGDDVPQAIRRMDLSVDLLGEDDLASGDLQKYDAVVVGIRAYQVRRDLIANNKRLLDFAQNGGTLIVQYQRPDYVAQNLQPFPASMIDTQKTTAGTTARVVDENARVKILQPQSPVFNFPNKITGADFDGWVQERNLYNFTTFDAQYTPLLEAHDAGEMENKGGMVFAKIGRGNYIYTSYSFFRQLPAGVPGAYRLFANLLSLSKAGK